MSLSCIHFSLFFLLSLRGVSCRDAITYSAISTWCVRVHVCLRACAKKRKQRQKLGHNGNDVLTRDYNVDLHVLLFFITVL